MDKVGRNDPCPCGSGKKYKKCCEEKVKSKKFTAQILEPAAAQPANKLTSLFKQSHIKPPKPPEEQPKEKIEIL
jgi:hypothetical protein